MLTWLNNMSVRKRMLLGVAVLLITLVIAMAQTYLVVHRDIDLALAEKKGNRAIRPLAAVLSDAVDLRMVMAMAREGRPVTDPLGVVVDSINANMDEIERLFAEIGHDLHFATDALAMRGKADLTVEKLQARWQQLSTDVRATPAGDHDAAIVALIDAVRGMIAHAGDVSGLMLDPDLDSAYLADVTLRVMPQTFDRLSGIGSDLYTWQAGEVAADHRVESRVYARLLAQGDIDRIIASMDASLKEDANYNGKSASYERNVVGALNDYRDANRKLAETLLAIGDGNDMARDDFVRVFQTAKETAYVFWAVGLDELDALIDTRIYALRAQQTQIILLSALGLLLSIAAYVVIMHSLTRPLTSLSGAMTRLAQGDTAIDVPYVLAQSEIGQMSRALDVFKRNAIDTARLRDEQARIEDEQARSRRQSMQALAEGFQAEVGGVVDGVAAAAREMTGTAHQLSRLMADTNTKSAAVAAASEEASMNVQAVAGATEQLSASINEISQQVAHSAMVARAAKDKAGFTNQQVRSLVDAASKIGVVVNLISDIAEQTNLLALNATIEAARAGDAGKGFAVVAGEVKSLATQTASATAQIEAQIHAIQDATRTAADAIGEIVNTIDGISGIASSVAAAVEQQGAATSEIARNIQQACLGTREVAENISLVTQAAQETGVASGSVQTAAGALTKQSEQLQQAVFRFVQSVRS